MTDKKPRCVNYDWLEVYCLESTEHTTPTAEYYQQRLGLHCVEVRAYGTPMYAEMFTIKWRGKPAIEVRRNPLSRISMGGIFPDNSCHLRLTNRTCYFPDPVGFLLQFMRENHYIYQSTTRIDICYDFQHFDNGDEPAKFLRKYYANKYAKMYQREFNNHGRDGWQAKLHNSVKWGKTPVSTKLYDKTEELDRTGHDKPYIREAWKACGLTGDDHVWRVEFSIKPELKNLVKEEDGTLLDVDLMAFRTRPQICVLFFTLADRYFDFRYVETLPSGKLQRKDRCKRKVLFKYSTETEGYKPVQLPTDKLPEDRGIIAVIKRMAELSYETASRTERQAIEDTCRMIIRTYATDNFHYTWWMHKLYLEFSQASNASEETSVQ